MWRNADSVSRFPRLLLPTSTLSDPGGRKGQSQEAQKASSWKLGPQTSGGKSLAFFMLLPPAANRLFRSWSRVRPWGASGGWSSVAAPHLGLLSFPCMDL